MSKYRLKIESIDDVDRLPVNEGKVLVYYDSDSDTFHSVNPDGSVTESEVDLTNYYTKSNSYSKTEVNNNFLSGNTSYYTQAQANANFLSGNTTLTQFIPNPSQFDMIFYSGTTWRVIPAGSPGDVLTLTENGPEWSGV